MRSHLCAPLGLVLLWAVPALAAEVVGDAKITEVVVYPDAAMLTRSAKVTLSPGGYTVVMPNLVTEIDQNTLRVSASGTAQMKLYGAQVKHRFVEEAPVAKEAELRKSIQALEDRARQLNDRRADLHEARKQITGLVSFSGVQVPREIQTKMPAVRDLDELMRFVDARLRDNSAALMEADLALRDITIKADALRKELSQIGGSGRKQTTVIEIDLEVLKGGGATVEASYMVGGCSWSPVYDARAELEKGKVELISYGVVRQGTGEEWSDVAMALSTARPSIGGRMPRVEPWVVRQYAPPVHQYDKKSKGKRAEMPMSAPAQSMAFAKDDAVGGAPPPPAPAEVAYSTSEEAGVAIVYRLPRKVTVKSDGSDHKVPVTAQELNAVFEYSAWPRASTHAYLGSRVRNRDDVRLMAGPMNVFYEGGFVGASSLDGIGPGEEFEVSLGVDDNVKVKRELSEKKLEDNDGIFSSSKKALYRYKITVENYKSKKITVNLYESMPVAEHEKIDVTISKVSLEPKKKDWDGRKGVWKWELELKPKEKREITYQFTVEHPRDLQVEGL